jgi:hypothetical protein
MVKETYDNDIAKLNPTAAKHIIDIVGSSGQPPTYGYQFFTSGIEEYVSTIEKEYLSDYISKGGSTFKLVIGSYGGGKTHFLYSIQGKAWEHNFVTSYIELSQHASPFHKLEEVYRSIMSSLIYPQDFENFLEGFDKGLESVIKSWFLNKYEEFSKIFSHDEILFELEQYVKNLGPFESTSYQNAIKHAFLSQYHKNDNNFNLILQWLKGENPPKNLLKEFHIFEKLDKSTAFKFLRDTNVWIQQIGYNGLIILMDEAEQTSSMSSKQRETLLNNLREIVDACTKGTLKKTMIFYAVPDINFLEGRTAIYEALNQRLRTIFEGKMNHSGVKIDLENVQIDPIFFLNEVGDKLAKIYELGYNTSFDTQLLHETIQEVAENSYEEKYGGISYKRVFVQNAVNTFHKLRSNQSQ